MNQRNRLRILIVDDEPDIIEFLAYNLEKEGYEVHKALNGFEAIDKANEIIPHMILMDVMMPGMDGIETCGKIRENPKLNSTLVTFLTARGEDYSQIFGFEAGGDDYVTKPIKPKVLMSRIRASLKRVSEYISQEGDEGIGKVIEKGDLTIDREKYVVYKSGKQLILPKKEFELLTLLDAKPGKVFSRDEIFNKVWGDDIIVGDRTIDVHIRKLREKIGDDYIETVKGVGYKYKEI